jgi:S-formylglutathione hydrolase FrmB
MRRLIFSAVVFCLSSGNFLFSIAATSKTMEIPSPRMGNRSWKAVIILPESYKKSSNRYSVIYLLHGYSQNFQIWPAITDLGAYSDTFQLIFVCPDGNYNSWYIDSPENSASAFETYIAHEVPAFVDSCFKTNKSRYGRAIAGSSMGGHGALTIFVRHKDMFCAAASLSGILDIREFPLLWDISAVLGQFKKYPERWKDFSFAGLVEKTDSISGAMLITCGKSDFALPSTRAVHQQLLAKNISHVYIEADGGHTIEFTRRSFPQALRFMAAKVAAPIAR